MEIFPGNQRLKRMNFLAHLYLSGDNKEVRLGNFIGDAVKGNSLDRFPEMIRAGIWLHREIDSYTDIILL